MTRLMMFLFAGLTIGAAVLTYYNVGLEETRYAADRSIRSGSSGGGGGFFSGGGYRNGK